MAQGVVIVLIFIAGENAEDARARHFEEGMLAKRGNAGVLQGAGKRLRQTNLRVELPQRQEPRIAAQLGIRGFYNNGQLAPKIESHLPRSLYTHNRPPYACYDLSL